MSGQAPKSQLIYVLWGTDRFTRDEQVRGLKRRMLAEPFGEYNLSVLSGDDVTVRDVRAVADALPFMGDRRLIVVEGLLGRLAGRAKPGARRGADDASHRPRAPRRSAAGEGGRAGLRRRPGDRAGRRCSSDLPPTTALVLVEDQIDPALVESWLPADRAHVRGYERPRPAELGRWIERRAKQHGGRIEGGGDPPAEPARPGRPRAARLRAAEAHHLRGRPGGHPGRREPALGQPGGDDLRAAGRARAEPARPGPGPPPAAVPARRALRGDRPADRRRASAG